MLNVPHFNQREDGFCLPACVQMVLAFYGVQANQEQLSKQMGVVAPIGTSLRSITRIRSSLPKTLTVSASEAEDVQQLYDALSKGTPPVLRVITGDLPYWTFATTHALVLIGIEGEQAFVNDPAFSHAPIALNREFLFLAWMNAGALFGLIERQQNS